jgi:hypothetical protein
MRPLSIYFFLCQEKNMQAEIMIIEAWQEGDELFRGRITTLHLTVSDKPGAATCRKTEPILP